MRCTALIVRGVCVSLARSRKLGEGETGGQNAQRTARDENCILNQAARNEEVVPNTTTSAHAHAQLQTLKRTATSSKGQLNTKANQWEEGTYIGVQNDQSQSNDDCTMFLLKASLNHKNARGGPEALTDSHRCRNTEPSESRLPLHVKTMREKGPLSKNHEIELLIGPK